MFEPSPGPSERGTMNKLKGESMIQVSSHFGCKDFKNICSPADKAWPVEDTAYECNCKLHQQEVVYLVDDFVVATFLNTFLNAGKLNS